METSEKKYLYSVNPRRPIILPGVKPIRIPRSLYLDKSQVEICMKSGYVYRRFANEGHSEKVNTDNIDRLHNEKFMTEAEYEEFIESSKYGNRGTVLDTSNHSSITYDSNPSNTRSVVLDRKEDEKKEETHVEDNTSDEVKNVSVDDDTEDKGESENTEDKKETNNCQNQYKNNKNRQHKR